MEEPLLHRLCATVVLFQLCLSVSSVGLLDVDDLKHSQFEISIRNKPVLLNSFYDGSLTDEDESHSDDDLPENSLVLSSKYGQLYQCSIPSVPAKDHSKDQSENVSAESVVKLLSPMKDGPCLFYTKGWWSYEFCYGREVKQYHFENGAIQGETISLGKFESDYNWEKTEEWEASTNTKLKKRKHHSQYYVNGSLCDLTGDSRKTEVRFKCDEDLKGADMDVIGEIEEPSSCTYLFTVSTIRICSHPRFRGEKVKKSSPISCSPALSKVEFEKYTELQETTAKRVKEMGERLRNLNAKYGEKVKIVSKDMPLGQQDASSSKLSPTLEKFFKEVYSPNKLKKQDEEGKPPNQNPDEDLEEFQQEANTLSSQESAAAKKTIASALKGQFEDIYEEAKEELVKETGQDFQQDTDTDKAALETLTKTLNKLLDQLDQTEKQLDTTGKSLKESLDDKQDKKDKWWKKHDESSVMDKNKKEGKMAHDDEEKLEQWIQNKMEEDENKGIDKSDENNLVKVRISKITKSKTNEKGMQPISIDEKDEKKLSKAVQEELEKAGLLDTQGRQVEVRIVTSGFFEDEDEDGVHTLSHGDSSQFRTLLSSLLGANSQQITEEYRKSQMKSNYKFVWNGQKTDNDNTDSDETEEINT